MKCKQIFLLLTVFAKYGLSTLSISDRKSKVLRARPAKPGGIASSVYDLNLVQNRTDIVSVLEHHNQYHSNVSIKNFPRVVLGFVSPTVENGYRVAKLFSPKLSLVSPMWYDVQQSQHYSQPFVLGGQKEVDEAWMKKVLSKNKGIQFLPHIKFAQWADRSRLVSTLKDKEVRDIMAEAIADIVGISKFFKGLVFDLTSPMQDADMLKLSALLCSKIGSILAQRSGNMTHFVLVLPPVLDNRNHPSQLSQEVLRELTKTASAIVLLAMEFSSVQYPGPNAPLNWIESNIVSLLEALGGRRADKVQVLLGIQFHGMDYTANGGGVIGGKEYTRLLEAAIAGDGVGDGRRRYFQPKMAFLSDYGEHRTEVKVQNLRHHVYFPTLESLRLRIQLARSHGLGIAVPDIGLGLDYFFDLL